MEVISVLKFGFCVRNGKFVYRSTSGLRDFFCFEIGETLANNVRYSLEKKLTFYDIV